VSVSPARRAAYEVLLRVFEQDAYADRAFRTAAKDLDDRERAFAQRLAYGAVQRVRTLDHAIETLGKRPVRKLDPPVRAALRLGAYQLGYTDTAPHAAANESVELVRRARLERAVPFTNAVMRRVAAGIDELLASLPKGSPLERFPLHRAVIGGQLVVSTTQRGIDDFRSGGPKLSADPAFLEAKKQSGMPDETTGFAYANARDALPLLALAGVTLPAGLPELGTVAVFGAVFGGGTATGSTFTAYVGLPSS